MSARTPTCRHASCLVGVWLNGRQYKQGDHCAYLPYVRPRYQRRGVGGHLGSSTSHRIGTIQMFYSLVMTGAPSRPRECQCVVVVDRPVKSLDHGMYITDSVRQDTEQVKFNYEPTHTSTFIHVDSITHKVKLVPHYDKALKDTLMCGISMWSAR